MNQVRDLIMLIHKQEGFDQEVDEEDGDHGLDDLFTPGKPQFHLP